jgi:hypothetical protein
MNTLIKAVMAAIVACAFTAPAFAYTINGTIPPGRAPVVIHLHRPLQPSLMRFKFSAPPKNAGVPYALDFCIGPAANPCGLPSSHVINVPEGQERFADFDSALFRTNILVVGQGTRVAVPFSVEVE